MAYKCHNFCDGEVLKAEPLNAMEQAIVELEKKSEPEHTPGDSETTTMSQKAVTEELYGMVPIEFEVGNLASANGGLNPAPNEDRLRSNYIKIDSILSVASLDTNFVMYVYAFDSSRAYLGIMGTWISGVEIADVVAKYPTTAYIRLVVKRPSNAKLYPEDVYGKIVCMRSKFITEPLIVSHPHAQYFQVTWNGIVSLKPEFRGAPGKAKYPTKEEDGYPDALSNKHNALGFGFAGSRNNELPENLIIPDMIGNVAVKSIAKGAFYGNKAIKNVTLPSAVTEIPERCFRESTVENVYNIEQVTSLGHSAFQESNVRRIELPKLTTMAAQAFCQCSYLVYVDIGEVKKIANDVFFRCPALSTIASANKITEVGVTSLQGTRSLANASFVNNLTKIGIGAFINSALPCDWRSLTDCTFGYNATPLQIHSDERYQKSTENDAPSGEAWTGYDAYFDEAWEGYKAKRTSEGKTFDCENPLPTLFCQADPRWYERPIGDTVFEYGGQGCSIFSLIHAYCGFHRLPLTTVVDFENVAEKLSPGILDKFSDNYSVIEGNEEKGTRVVAEGIGLDYIPGASFIYSEDADGNKTYRNGLREVFDALGDGNYVVVNGYNGSSAGRITGHAILLYGLTKDGQFKVASSGIRYYDDKTRGSKYIMPYKAMLEPVNPSGTNSFFIVRLSEEA